MSDSPSPPASRRGKIYLIGFMGAGKSTVGAQLARLLTAEFVDLDRFIESRQDMRIPEIFSTSGERGFRRLESEALRGLSRRRGDLVIATGGGATTVSANVAVMRATGTAVWLDPPFEVILDRLDSTGRRTRPLFSSPAEARALFQERRVSYSVADIRLAVAAGESASGVAERVLRALLGANSGVSNGDRGT